MVLAFASPTVDLWFVFVLECEKQVFTVSEELIGRPPSIETETAKFISILILNHKDSVFVFFASLEESD